MTSSYFPSLPSFYTYLKRALYGFWRCSMWIAAVLYTDWSCSTRNDRALHILIVLYTEWPCSTRIDRALHGLIVLYTDWQNETKPHPIECGLPWNPWIWPTKVRNRQGEDLGSGIWSWWCSLPDSETSSNTHCPHPNHFYFIKILHFYVWLLHITLGLPATTSSQCPCYYTPGFYVCLVPS